MYGRALKVTNLANGKSCIVEIQDWGPNPRLADKGIDLFTKAFNFLSNTQGYQAAYNIGVLTNIKVEHIEKSTTTAAAASSNADKTKQQVVQEQAKAVKKEQANSILGGALEKVTNSINRAKTPEQQQLPTAKTLSGAQITVELGFDGESFVANSFIHTGLNYDHSSKTVSFTGQAATWAMTQRIKNTAYTNMNLKQVATKVTKSYGLNLKMDESGPTYDYFPQRGISDYESILTEAKRLGYQVSMVGNTLSIQKRDKLVTSKGTFVLAYGENAGINLEISHQASSDSSGGARSASPGANNSTGEMKFTLDADSGQIKQTRLENITGSGKDNTQITTGTASKIPTPVISNNSQVVDHSPKEDSMRVKGILANADFPTTPESLLLTPDAPFKTVGFTKTTDRYWVVESVTHDYQLGVANTKVTLYSPLKNKNPVSTNTSTNTAINTTAQPQITNSTFDPSAPKFIRPMKGGTVTSLHRTENPKRPNHKGIDISSVGGTGPGSQILAAAAGTATVYLNSTGGYGNFIDINHGGGWLTRYAHLYSVSIANGQSVSQGQVIGIEGNSGGSRGTHLHVEVRKDGADLNPLKYIPK